MSRRQTFLQQIRGRSTPTLLVDGGDIFFGVPSKKASSRAEETRALTKARKILNAYNYMGYDVLGLGPSDLQFGVDRLRSFLKSTKIPVVCANLVNKATGETVFQPSTIVTVDGVRFGVFGVVLSTLNESYKKRIIGESYALLDALETTKKVVPELRKRCDIVVALSHINIVDNIEVIQQVPGIDLIVDPYSRNGNQPVWITDGDYVEWVKNKPLLRIDGQGSRVGICELSIPASGSTEDDVYVYDYPLEPQIFDHPEMAKIVRGTFIPTNPNRDPRKAEPLPDLFMGEELCGSCHEAQHKFWKKTAHAAAYKTLEKTNEQFKHECIECHTVGYGVAFVDAKKPDSFTDVQCESCHGINHRHAENPNRYRVGSVKDSRCWGCHNPQILQKPFFLKEVKGGVSCPKME